MLPLAEKGITYFLTLIFFLSYRAGSVHTGEDLHFCQPSTRWISPSRETSSANIQRGSRARTHGRQVSRQRAQPWARGKQQRLCRLRSEPRAEQTAVGPGLLRRSAGRAWASPASAVRPPFIGRWRANSSGGAQWLLCAAAAERCGRRWWGKWEMPNDKSAR